MGDSALDTLEEQPEEGKIEVKEEVEPKEGDVTPEGESSEVAEEDTGFEVVLDRVEDSQPNREQEINRIVQKRVNKANAKIEAIQETADQATNDSLIKDEKIKLLELALEQKKESEAVKAPDPDDFVDTSEFIKANAEYTQSLVASEVQKHLAAIPAPAANTPAPDSKLQGKQSKHYQAVEELEVKGYDELEDSAVQFVGRDVINYIIQGSPPKLSVATVAFLAKNQKKSEELAHLFANDLHTATLELGRLQANLKVKPRANSQHAPDPDEELEGGSQVTMSGIDKKIEAARAKVQDGTGDMNEVIKLKKQKLDQESK